MDASQLPKGKSQETTDGRPVNPPGVYVHGPTGARMITSPGNEGIVMADAVMNPEYKGAWKRVGDVPTREELLAMNKTQRLEDAKAEAAVKAAEKAELDEAVKAEETTPAKAK